MRYALINYVVFYYTVHKSDTYFDIVSGTVRDVFMDWQYNI